LNQTDSFSQSDSENFLNVAEFLLQHNRELSPFLNSETELSRKGQYIIGSDKGLLIDLNLKNGVLPFGYQSPFDFEFSLANKSHDFETFGDYKIGFLPLAKEDFFSRLSTEKIHFVEHFIWLNQSIRELLKTNHLSYLFSLEEKTLVLITKDVFLMNAFKEARTTHKMFNILESKVVHNSNSYFFKVAKTLSDFCQQKFPQAKAEGRMISLPLDFFTDEELEQLENQECLRIKKSKDSIPLFFTPTLNLEVIQNILFTIFNFKDKRCLS